MVRIRRFGILQTASTVAVAYVIAILIIAVPVILLVTLLGNTGQPGGQAIDTGPVLVVAIAGAALYGVVAWIGTAIACGLYNLAARVTGGLEVQVDTFTPPPAPAWGAPDAPAQAPPG